MPNLFSPLLFSSGPHDAGEIHENEAFRKNFQITPVEFEGGLKNFENGAFRKRCGQDNSVSSLLRFFWNTNPK